MKFAIRSILFVLVSVALPAQTFPTTTSLPALIPDGTGACVSGAGLVLTIPVSGITTATAVSLQFTCSPAHTWYGDIKCVVRAPSGATAVAMSPFCEGSLDDPSDVAGPYVLSDNAAMSFDLAAFNTAPTGTIPAGTYAPDSALNPLLICGSPNGNWQVTFSDFYLGDFGTVSACSLIFGTGAPTNSFTVCQASPGAAVNLIHTAGANPVTYTNVATFGTPAAIPFGWWFGLAIPLQGPAGLLDQLTNASYGPIFIGSLAAGGTSIIPAPLPVGFNFQVVGVHFNAAGQAIYSSVPVDFTVL